MNQVAIWTLLVGLVCGLPIGWALRSPEPIKPNWQTLVIWRNADWKISAMQWLPGPVTKEQAEAGPFKPFANGAVLETFTVPGHPANAEHLQSIAH